MNNWLLTSGLWLLPWLGWGQVQFSWNANMDTELTRAGDLSHYYYNEIHRNYTGWQLDLARVDLQATLHLSTNWKVRMHLLMERDLGQRAGWFQELDQYALRWPQLNVQWAPSGTRFRLTAGQFITPFGSVYADPLYADRTFINFPLAYDYYTNISNRIGYVPGLHEDQPLQIDGRPEWGNPTLYRLGYSAGLRADVEVGDQGVWSIALINGAPNRDPDGLDWKQWGVVSRINIQPAYFVKLGISASYGTYLEETAFTDMLEPARASYWQMLWALDYQLSFGYWQWSGEVVGAHYRAPLYSTGSENGRPAGYVDDSASLFELGTHSDLRYEPPFLSGGFIAYRWSYLYFGPAAGIDNWDNPVTRHALALGYKINHFTVVKLQLSTQQTQGRPWDNRQRTLRLMASFYW